ncbi:translational GTPase TypA [Myxococcota bacterium]|jgi:GTP-binding protein|nr:translational GTPase TypA [Myxococcota bacterium]
MPELRNIAIIAHVDHGKTTLVDGLLRQSGTFAAHEVHGDRIMDSMDLERERGITILAKNTAVLYNGVKINIVDTPGHADFGGEVERVLKMVDGALLLVDASEGPLPQTRFVLRKALEAELRVMVCVNKIDRPDARIQEVLDEVYSLFIDLDASDNQIEFPVIFACAREGYCSMDKDVKGTDFKPLFDAIIDYIPAPKGKLDHSPQFIFTQLGYDPYVGRLAIGRLVNGTLRKRQDMMLVGEHGNTKVRVNQVYTYQGLRRVELEGDAVTGDILAVAGIDDLNIGDTLTSIDDPKPLARVRVEEPTIGMVFSANNGPFSGQDGKLVTARQIRERLEKELLHNVALRMEETDGLDAYRVYGRGELQLAILIEQMRREGFELCVSKPEVVIREVNGKQHEPFELAQLDFPEQYMGMITESMALRKGRMTEMKMSGSGRVRIEFRVPSRGLIGFRGSYLNDTRGMGIMNTIFEGFDEHAGYIPFRQNGSLLADRTGQTTAYALFNLQARGALFVGAGVEVYEGMIVGENTRENDMNLNVCRSKQLTNIRTTSADEKLVLVPPIILTLEKALEFISDDELVEVTPHHIRMRKRILAGNMRSVVRGERADAAKKK